MEPSSCTYITLKTVMDFYKYLKRVICSFRCQFAGGKSDSVLQHRTSDNVDCEALELFCKRKGHRNSQCYVPRHTFQRCCRRWGDISVPGGEQRSQRCIVVGHLRLHANTPKNNVTGLLHLHLVQRMLLSMIRSLEREPRYVWERVQALKLARHCMCLAPSETPLALLKSLIAIASHTGVSESSSSSLSLSSNAAVPGAAGGAANVGPTATAGGGGRAGANAGGAAGGGGGDAGADGVGNGRPPVPGGGGAAAAAANPDGAPGGPDAGAAAAPQAGMSSSYSSSSSAPNNAGPDNLRGPALETIRCAAVTPELLPLVASAGGITVLIDALMETAVGSSAGGSGSLANMHALPLCPGQSPVNLVHALTFTLLRLMSDPASRPYVPPAPLLDSLASVWTVPVSDSSGVPGQSTASQHHGSAASGISAAQRARWAAGRHLFVTLARTWVGHLALFSDQHTLPSLLTLLIHPMHPQLLLSALRLLLELLMPPAAAVAETFDPLSPFSQGLSLKSAADGPASDPIAYLQALSLSMAHANLAAAAHQHTGAAYTGITSRSSASDATNKSARGVLSRSSEGINPPSSASGGGAHASAALTSPNAAAAAARSLYDGAGMPPEDILQLLNTADDADLPLLTAAVGSPLAPQHLNASCSSVDAPAVTASSVPVGFAVPFFASEARHGIDDEPEYQAAFWLALARCASGLSGPRSAAAPSAALSSGVSTQAVTMTPASLLQSYRSHVLVSLLQAGMLRALISAAMHPNPVVALAASSLTRYVVQLGLELLPKPACDALWNLPDALQLASLASYRSATSPPPPIVLSSRLALPLCDQLSLFKSMMACYGTGDRAIVLQAISAGAVSLQSLPAVTVSHPHLAAARRRFMQHLHALLNQRSRAPSFVPASLKKGARRRHAAAAATTSSHAVDGSHDDQPSLQELIGVDSATDVLATNDAPMRLEELLPSQHDESPTQHPDIAKSSKPSQKPVIQLADQLIMDAHYKRGHSHRPHQHQQQLQPTAAVAVSSAASRRNSQYPSASFRESEDSDSVISRMDSRRSRMQLFRADSRRLEPGTGYDADAVEGADIYGYDSRYSAARGGVQNSRNRYRSDTGAGGYGYAFDSFGPGNESGNRRASAAPSKSGQFAGFAMDANLAGGRSRSPGPRGLNADLKSISAAPTPSSIMRQDTFQRPQMAALSGNTTAHGSQHHHHRQQYEHEFGALSRVTNDALELLQFEASDARDGVFTQRSHGRLVNDFDGIDGPIGRSLYHPRLQSLLADHGPSGRPAGQPNASFIAGPSSSQSFALSDYARWHGKVQHVSKKRNQMENLRLNGVLPSNVGEHVDGTDPTAGSTPYFEPLPDRDASLHHRHFPHPFSGHAGPLNDQALLNPLAPASIGTGIGVRHSAWYDVPSMPGNRSGVAKVANNVVIPLTLPGAHVPPMALLHGPGSGSFLAPPNPHSRAQRAAVLAGNRRQQPDSDGVMMRGSRYVPSAFVPTQCLPPHVGPSIAMFDQARAAHGSSSIAALLKTIDGLLCDGPSGAADVFGLQSRHDNSLVSALALIADTVASNAPVSSASSKRGSAQASPSASAAWSLSAGRSSVTMPASGIAAAAHLLDGMTSSVTLVHDLDPSRMDVLLRLFSRLAQLAVTNTTAGKPVRGSRQTARKRAVVATSVSLAADDRVDSQLEVSAFTNAGSSGPEVDEPFVLHRRSDVDDVNTSDSGKGIIEGEEAAAAPDADDAYSDVSDDSASSEESDAWLRRLELPSKPSVRRVVTPGGTRSHRNSITVARSRSRSRVQAGTSSATRLVAPPSLALPATASDMNIQAVAPAESDARDTTVAAAPAIDHHHHATNVDAAMTSDGDVAIHMIAPARAAAISAPASSSALATANTSNNATRQMDATAIRSQMHAHNQSNHGSESKPGMEQLLVSPTAGVAAATSSSTSQSDALQEGGAVSQHAPSSDTIVDDWAKKGKHKQQLQHHDVGREGKKDKALAHESHADAAREPQMSRDSEKSSGDDHHRGQTAPAAAPITSPKPRVADNLPPVPTDGVIAGPISLSLVAKQQPESTAQDSPKLNGMQRGVSSRWRVRDTIRPHDPSNPHPAPQFSLGLPAPTDGGEPVDERSAFSTAAGDAGASTATATAEATALAVSNTDDGSRRSDPLLLSSTAGVPEPVGLTAPAPVSSVAGTVGSSIGAATSGNSLPAESTAAPAADADPTGAGDKDSDELRSMVAVPLSKGLGARLRNFLTAAGAEKHGVGSDGKQLQRPPPGKLPASGVSARKLPTSVFEKGPDAKPIGPQSQLNHDGGRDNKALVRAKSAGIIGRSTGAEAAAAKAKKLQEAATTAPATAADVVPSVDVAAAVVPTAAAATESAANAVPERADATSPVHVADGAAAALDLTQPGDAAHLSSTDAEATVGQSPSPVDDVSAQSLRLRESLRRLRAVSDGGATAVTAGTSAITLPEALQAEEGRATPAGIAPDEVPPAAVEHVDDDRVAPAAASAFEGIDDADAAVAPQGSANDGNAEDDDVVPSVRQSRGDSMVTAATGDAHEASAPSTPPRKTSSAAVTAPEAIVSAQGSPSQGSKAQLQTRTPGPLGGLAAGLRGIALSVRKRTSSAVSLAGMAAAADAAATAEVPRRESIDASAMPPPPALVRRSSAAGAAGTSEGADSTRTSIDSFSGPKPAAVAVTTMDVDLGGGAGSSSRAASMDTARPTSEAQQATDGAAAASSTAQPAGLLVAAPPTTATAKKQRSLSFALPRDRSPEEAMERQEPLSASAAAGPLRSARKGSVGSLTGSAAVPSSPSRATGQMPQPHLQRSKSAVGMDRASNQRQRSELGRLLEEDDEGMPSSFKTPSGRRGTLAGELSSGSGMIGSQSGRVTYGRIPSSVKLGHVSHVREEDRAIDWDVLSFSKGGLRGILRAVKASILGLNRVSPAPVNRGASGEAASPEDLAKAIDITFSSPDAPQAAASTTLSRREIAVRQRLAPIISQLWQAYSDLPSRLPLVSVDVAVGSGSQEHLMPASVVLVCTFENGTSFGSLVDSSAHGSWKRLAGYRGVGSFTAAPNTWPASRPHAHHYLSEVHRQVALRSMPGHSAGARAGAATSQVGAGQGTGKERDAATAGLITATFTAIRNGKVLSGRDWRLWDWGTIAVMLDHHLTNPVVLTEIITKTQFMHRMGEFFCRISNGSNSAGLNAVPGTPGMSAVNSSSSSEQSPSVAPTPSTTVFNAGNNMASLPWIPSSLRFIRAARQWLLLCLHHPLGRELLQQKYKRDAAASKQGIPEPQGQGLASELFLAIWTRLSDSCAKLARGNAAVSRTPSASTSIGASAARMFATAASRAKAAVGGADAGKGSASGAEAAEAAVAVIVRDTIGPGANGEAHASLFVRQLFDTTLARELMSLLGVFFSCKEGMEIVSSSIKALPFHDLPDAPDALSLVAAVSEVVGVDAGLGLGKHPLLQESRAQSAGSPNTGAQRSQGTVPSAGASTADPSSAPATAITAAGTTPADSPGAVAAAPHSIIGRGSHKHSSSDDSAAARASNPAQLPSILAIADDPILSLMHLGATPQLEYLARQLLLVLDYAPASRPVGGMGPGPVILAAWCTRLRPQVLTTAASSSSLQAPTAKSGIGAATMPVQSPARKPNGSVASRAISMLRASSSIGSLGVEPAWGDQTHGQPPQLFVSIRMALYATCFLRVLLRRGVPGFADWGIQLLVTQLQCPAIEIARAALRILVEAAARSRVYKLSILARKPQLSRFNQHDVAPLAELLVSDPAGYRYLAMHCPAVLASMLDGWLAADHIDWTAAAESSLTSAMTYNASVLDDPGPLSALASLNASKSRARLERTAALLLPRTADFLHQHDSRSSGPMSVKSTAWKRLRNEGTGTATTSSNAADAAHVMKARGAAAPAEPVPLPLRVPIQPVPADGDGLAGLDADASMSARLDALLHLPWRVEMWAEWEQDVPISPSLQPSSTFHPTFDHTAASGGHFRADGSRYMSPAGLPRPSTLATGSGPAGGGTAAAESPASGFQSTLTSTRGYEASAEVAASMLSGRDPHIDIAAAGDGLASLPGGLDGSGLLNATAVGGGAEGNAARADAYHQDDGLAAAGSAIGVGGLGSGPLASHESDVDSGRLGAHSSFYRGSKATAAAATRKEITRQTIAVDTFVDLSDLHLRLLGSGPTSASSAGDGASDGFIKALVLDPRTGLPAPASLPPHAIVRAALFIGSHAVSDLGDIPFSAFSAESQAASSAPSGDAAAGAGTSGTTDATGKSVQIQASCDPYASVDNVIRALASASGLHSGAGSAAAVGSPSASGAGGGTRRAEGIAGGGRTRSGTRTSAGGGNPMGNQTSPLRARSATATGANAAAAGGRAAAAMGRRGTEADLGAAVVDPNFAGFALDDQDRLSTTSSGTGAGAGGTARSRARSSTMGGSARAEHQTPTNRASSADPVLPKRANDHSSLDDASLRLRMRNMAAISSIAIPHERRNAHEWVADCGLLDIDAASLHPSATSQSAGSNAASAAAGAGSTPSQHGPKAEALAATMQHSSMGTVAVNRIPDFAAGGPECNTTVFTPTVSAYRNTAQTTGLLRSSSDRHARWQSLHCDRVAFPAGGAAAAVGVTSTKSRAPLPASQNVIPQASVFGADAVRRESNDGAGAGSRSTSIDSNGIKRAKAPSGTVSTVASAETGQAADAVIDRVTAAGVAAGPIAPGVASSASSQDGSAVHHICPAGSHARFAFSSSGSPGDPTVRLHSIDFAFCLLPKIAAHMSLRPNLYGSMACHRSGSRALLKSGHIRALVEVAFGPEASTAGLRSALEGGSIPSVEDALGGMKCLAPSIERRSALWALAHIGASECGFEALTLVCPDVLVRFDAAARGLRLLAVQAPSFSSSSPSGTSEVRPSVSSRSGASSVHSAPLTLAAVPEPEDDVSLRMAAMQSIALFARHSAGHELLTILGWSTFAPSSSSSLTAAPASPSLIAVPQVPCTAYVLLPRPASALEPDSLHALDGSIGGHSFASDPDVLAASPVASSASAGFGGLSASQPVDALPLPPRRLDDRQLPLDAYPLPRGYKLPFLHTTRLPPLPVLIPAPPSEPVSSAGIPGTPSAVGAGATGLDSKPGAPIAVTSRLTPGSGHSSGTNLYETILHRVTELNSRITQREARQALVKLKNERPDMFAHAHLYAHVHALLSRYTMTLPIRRFLHTLFDRVSFSDRSWDY